MLIKIAINEHFVDKINMNGASRAETRSVWREFNGSFSNRLIPIPVLVQEIKKGHAYTAQHRWYRKKDAFVAGQHIGLDFDTGDERSSIARLKELEIVQKYACIIHSTPSSRPGSERSRVILIIDKPIINREAYEQAVSSVMFAVGNAGLDRACRDAVRVFFGAQGCNIFFNGKPPISPRQLGEEFVAPYLKEREEALAKRQALQKSFDSVDPHSCSDFFRTSVLNKHLQSMATAPDGHKYYTLVRVARTLGGYVGSGFLEREAVERALESVLSSRDLDDTTHAMQTMQTFIDFGINEPIVPYIPPAETAASDLGLAKIGIIGNGP